MAKEEIHSAPNPFCDVGSVVTGRRFIGRKQEIGLLSHRVLNPAGYGSVAVVGLPKVGKTTLVHHVFRESERDLAAKGVLSARLETGTFDRWQTLFRAMASDIAEAAVRLERGSRKLAEIAALLQHSVADEQLFPLLTKFFRCARQDGVRSVVILDEFDAARYIFTGADRCFHLLRELASNPEFKIALVIISKRELEDISGMAGHNSNYWANVLTTCYVRPFNDAEVECFFETLRTAGIELSTSERAQLLSRSGTHPMLLDLVGFDVVRRWQEAEPRLIREELDSEFVKLFGQICEVLEVGKRLSKLVQILVGPVYDASQMDMDALVRYGVLAKNQEGFRAFADSFGEYLPLVARTIDVWPLWRETETSLRRAVEMLLDQFYGNQWENALVKARPQLAKIINDCRNEKMREKEKFGAHGSDHTLDYTYPNDLLAIMSSNWKELGKPILGQDPSAWAPKFAVLAKVRNPLAHNRDFNLTYERQMAEAYCREILERVTEWNCTNETPL